MKIRVILKDDGKEVARFSIESSEIDGCTSVKYEGVDYMYGGVESFNTYIFDKVELHSIDLTGREKLA